MDLQPHVTNEGEDRRKTCVEWTQTHVGHKMEGVVRVDGTRERALERKGFGKRKKEDDPCEESTTHEEYGSVA